MEYIEIMHLVNGNIHVSTQDKERWNKNGYDEIQKVAPYLYEAWYSNLDYAKAERYFRTKAVPVTPSGCSAVRMGAFYGRNLDWYYNNQAEIMVHTKHEHGRNAVFGICSSMGGLDDAFVSSGMYSELYDYVPFMLVDGINEHGLVVNTNVVPAGEKGNNSYINWGSSNDTTICSLMLVRYLLDKCSSVADVKAFFESQPKIYQPLTLLKGGFEQHFMVADESSTAIIEFVNGSVEFIEDIKPIMTNFHLSGVTFNADGTVTTPAQITEVMASHPNGVTAHGSGLERYNIAIANYSKTYVKEEMLNLMTKLFYTNAYSLDCQDDERWNTEFVGFDGLLSYSKGVNYADTYERIANKHLSASRAESNFWQTVHSVVYDIENKTAVIRIQENASVVYERELDAIDYEAIKEIIKKEEGELTLDELIEKAINTGVETLVTEAKTQILALGDKNKLQYLGAGLASKGYEPYKYAGLTSKEGFDGKGISSFEYTLMSLENGSQMFMGSNVITSYASESPFLTNGQGMFNGCSNLVSVSGDFDKVTNGYNMFTGCTSLVDFSGNLGSLTNGKGMFDGCALTLDSLKNIVRTLNTVSGKPWLTLGLDCSYEEYSKEGSEWLAAVNAIEAKGWDARVQCRMNIVEEVIKAIASGNKARCQTLGAFAAETGIEEYKYAGAKTTEELKNLGYTEGDADKNIMSLEYGTNLYANSIMSEYSTPLPSLTVATSMFKEAFCIASFNVDMPNLTQANDMFTRSGFVEFTADMPNVTNVDGMFNGCQLLSKFVSNIPNAQFSSNTNMFDGCTSLTYVEPKGLTNASYVNFLINSLPEYTTVDGSHRIVLDVATSSDILGAINTAKQRGWNTTFTITTADTFFKNNTTLTTWNSELPNLTRAKEMFQGCANLTSVNVGSLDELTCGRSMFYGCTNLTSLDADYPNVVIGDGMFYDCKKYTRAIDFDMTSLTSGRWMFSKSGITKIVSDFSNLQMPIQEKRTYFVEGCTALEVFDADLSSIEYGAYMFQGLTNLRTYRGNLGKLQQGYWMYKNCTSLSSWDGNLSSLTNGFEMFYGCKLDLASVQKIAQTIKDVRGDNNTGGTAGLVYKTIHIDYAGGMTQAHKDAFTTMTNKGWTVIANGTEFKAPIYFGENLTSTQVLQKANSITDCEGRDVIFHVAESAIDWMGWEPGAIYWEGMTHSSINDAWLILSNKNCGNVYYKTNKTGDQLITSPMS